MSETFDPSDTVSSSTSGTTELTSTSKSSREHLSITIEDVAIETVIEMNQYMRENGIVQKKPLYGHHLVQWLWKNVS